MLKYSLSALAFFALSTAGHSALSIVADATTPMTLSSGGAIWNTVTFPPSNNANIYWDANSDGVFGNSALENTGNTGATLPFTVPSITSAVPLLFGVEGFATAGATGSVSFTLTNTDATTQFLNVPQGAPVPFADSNGAQWQANFVFNNGGYGDVVFNGGTPGNGANSPDHQGVLTFTQIPEPSATVILFGLAGFGLFVRRRR